MSGAPRAWRAALAVALAAVLLVACRFAVEKAPPPEQDITGEWRGGLWTGIEYLPISLFVERQSGEAGAYVVRGSVAVDRGGSSYRVFRFVNGRCSFMAERGATPAVLFWRSGEGADVASFQAEVDGEEMNGSAMLPSPAGGSRFASRFHLVKVL